LVDSGYLFRTVLLILVGLPATKIPEMTLSKTKEVE